jgi:vitamin-K-epoxide reductase (warfarin-sensitive)
MIIVLATVGLLISLYGITVERKLKQNPQHQAACDISDTISCTRPMLSAYNKMFGFSNIWASALYYLAIIALALLDQQQLLMLATSAGLLVTIVFAYILYFRIKSLCLICTALYLVNIALVATCYFS